METKQITLRSKTTQCPYCGEYYSITYKECPFCDGNKREERRARREKERVARNKSSKSARPSKGATTSPATRSKSSSSKETEKDAEKSKGGLFSSLFATSASEKTKRERNIDREKGAEGEKSVERERSSARKKSTRESAASAKTRNTTGTEHSQWTEERRKERAARRKTTEIEEMPQVQEPSPVFDTTTVPDTFGFVEDLTASGKRAAATPPAEIVPLIEKAPVVELDSLTEKQSGDTAEAIREIPVFIPPKTTEKPISPDLSGSGEALLTDPAEFSRQEFLQDFVAPAQSATDTTQEATGKPVPAREAEESTGGVTSITMPTLPSEKARESDEPDLDVLLAEIKAMLDGNSLPREPQTAPPTVTTPTATTPADTAPGPVSTTPGDTMPAAPAPGATPVAEVVPIAVETPGKAATPEAQQEQPKEKGPDVEQEEVPVFQVPKAEEILAEAAEPEEDNPFVEVATVSAKKEAAAENAEETKEEAKKPKAANYEILFEGEWKSDEAEAVKRKPKGKPVATKKPPKPPQKKSAPGVKAGAPKKKPVAKAAAPAKGNTEKRGGKNAILVVVSLAVIAVALFILFHNVWPVFRNGVFSKGEGTEQVTAVVTDTADSLTLDQTDLSFNEAGATVILNPIFAPEGSQANLTWTSSDDAVATVDGYGGVTMISPGTATITATMANGQSAQCIIRCNWTADGTQAAAETPAEPTTPVLDDTSITLSAQGATRTLTVTGGGGNVQWNSNKPDVATISADGTVTAVSKGSATVTATVGEVTLTCAVKCIW